MASPFLKKNSKLLPNILYISTLEMEMKKLHMGTMSFGYDTMDEVSHQLSTAFGADGKIGPLLILCAHPSLATHAKHGSLSTGIQLATRGRRDISARVRDVVLSLALCHNVRSISFSQYTSHGHFFLTRSPPSSTTMALSPTKPLRLTKLP